PARTVGDPVQLTLDILAESYELSLQVLASDKESTEGIDLADTALDDRYGDAYYSRLYERERGTLRSRLAASATNLGSLWPGARRDLDRELGGQERHHREQGRGARRARDRRGHGLHLHPPSRRAHLGHRRARRTAGQRRFRAADLPLRAVPTGEAVRRQLRPQPAA